LKEEALDRVSRELCLEESVVLSPVNE